MKTLLDALAAALEKPRAISRQVVKFLAEQYGIERHEVGAFIASELPKLEEYEIDLILSPLFTPTLQDQAVFAELLGRASIPSEQWPALIEQVVQRPTLAHFVAPDGAMQPSPLREVTVERYVNRLRLDGSIPQTVFSLLANLLPPSDQPLLKAIARRAIWEDEQRQQILSRYLLASASNDEYRPEDALELLKLAETYQPTDVADLLARIPHWQEVLRHEIALAVNPKAFLNERIEEMHGGGRDQRRKNEGDILAKENEIASLERLKKVLTAPA